MENLLSFTFNMDSIPEEDLEAVNEYKSSERPQIGGVL